MGTTNDAQFVERHESISILDRLMAPAIAIVPWYRSQQVLASADEAMLTTKER